MSLEGTQSKNYRKFFVNYRNLSKLVTFTVASVHFLLAYCFYLDNILNKYLKNIYSYDN